MSEGRRPREEGGEEEQQGRQKQAAVSEEETSEEQRLQRNVRGTRRRVQLAQRLRAQVSNEISELRNVRATLEGRIQLLEAEADQINTELIETQGELVRAQQEVERGRVAGLGQQATIQALEDRVRLLQEEMRANINNAETAQGLRARVSAQLNRQIAQLAEINAELEQLTTGFAVLLPEEKRRRAYFDFLRDLLAEAEALNPAVFATVSRDQVLASAAGMQRADDLVDLTITISTIMSEYDPSSDGFVAFLQDTFERAITPPASP